MTLLVGQNGAGWTQVSVNEPAQGAGDTIYFTAGGGYTAAASGTMTFAHVTFFDAGSTANFVKVSVYTNAGVLVATSSPIAKATGDQSAAITGPITSGSQYYLVVQPDTGKFDAVKNSGGSGFVMSGNTPANFPYATPPSTLPARDYNSLGNEIIVWIEGTTGGAPTPHFGTLMGVGS